MHLLDLRRGRDRRGRRGRRHVRRHHAGPQRRQERPVRRQVVGDPVHRQRPPAYFIRGDKLAEKGIDPATPQDLRATAARPRSRSPGPDFYGWGLTPNQSGDGFGYLIGAGSGLRRPLHRRDRARSCSSTTPETVAAFEWLKETYDRNGKYAAMLPPGVESWTDTSQQRSLARGPDRLHAQRLQRLCAVQARQQPGLSQDIVLLRAPQANNGDSRDGGNVGGWMTIFKGSQNVDLAKKLALDLLDPANFGKMSAVGGVLFTPAYDEPLDRRTDRGRSEPCDHQGAGQRHRPVPRRSRGRPARTRASTPSAPRACSSSRSPTSSPAAWRPPMRSRTPTRRCVDIFEEGGMMQP